MNDVIEAVTDDKSKIDNEVDPENYDYNDDDNLPSADGKSDTLPVAASDRRILQGEEEKEAKKKRAHKIITQDSLARTLAADQGSAAKSSAEKPSGKTAVKIAFRTSVQHRVTAYVTWPSRPESCPDPIATSAIGYVFRYRALGTDRGGEFVTRSLTDNFVLLDNLVFNARYGYQVRYVTGGTESDWSQEAVLDTGYYHTS